MNGEAMQAAAAAMAAGTPLATHSEGWSYASVGIWLFGLIGTPTVIIALFKLIAAMKKLGNERHSAEDSTMLASFDAVIKAQAAEIGRLTERIDKLEREAKAEREGRTIELRHIIALHDAELGLQRHAARNAKQVLIGFLDRVEANPAEAASHAARMRMRMEELERQEAKESATIRSAKINAAGYPNIMGGAPA